jgi:transcriptional regulator with XRE-family HTH domain
MPRPIANPGFRRICSALNVTAEQLGQAIGCNHNSLTRWHNGLRHSPRLEQRLAELLAHTQHYQGLTVAELRQLVGLDKETAA